MTKEDILHHFQDINFYYNDCMMYDDLSRMLDELIAENQEEEIKMDKLKELEKRMDRIKALMDASGSESIEVMLATFASDFVDCDRCPLQVKCDPLSHKIDIKDMIDCYGEWLEYLEANDE